jgi:hypothetical protein
VSLCITTVVDKQYMEYVPLFVYCVNRAYPDAMPVIVLRDPCPYPMGKMKYTFITMFSDFPRYEYASIALRFLVPKEVYAEFDYVYVTDIDMLIMREETDIETFHRIEMESTGLCYSNSLRNAMHYAGSESLTGLHFATREWFFKTEDRAAIYREYMRSGLMGLYREWDGVMLYRMANMSGLGLPGKYKLAKRHHGIHLGNFRLFPDDKLKLDVRIPMPFRIEWLRLTGTKTYHDFFDATLGKNAQMDTQIEMMDKFAKGQK